MFLCLSEVIHQNVQAHLLQQLNFNNCNIICQCLTKLRYLTKKVVNLINGHKIISIEIICGKIKFPKPITIL